MALVAYENSDSSEYDDDDSEITHAVILNKEGVSPVADIKDHISTENSPDEGGSKLFTQLPQPSNKKPAVIEEDDEFLHKKESATAVKPKAKITVPSLSDFKDVEKTVPNAKPRVSNGKKSGLLSMLPQPRNAVTTSTRSLIPHSLTKKTNNTVKKKEPLPSPIKKAKVDTKLHESDESDGEEFQNDFFSFNKPNDIPVEEVSLDIDKSADGESQDERKPFNIESYFKPNAVVSSMEVDTEMDGDTVPGYNGSEASYSNEEPSSSSNGDVVLDDEAILKLCGTRGKRRREEIQIVDVHQKEVLGDAREWMLKSLMDDTTKRVSASKKKGNEPTNQQKRKHQITYLAHQAKANEAELQNQWANNRMTKRQTQSKYGF